MPSTLATLNNLAAEGSVLASHRGGDHEGGFFFLLLLLAAIGGGIYLIRRRRNGGADTIAPTPPPAPPAPGSNAQALLDERFAKGEIDQAEYEHRRAVLDGQSSTPPMSEPPAAPEAPAEESE